MTEAVYELVSLHGLRQKLRYIDINDHKCDVYFLTIRLFSAGLGEVLFGSLCISHLQSGKSCSVQCFDIARLPLQHPEAIVPHTGIVNILLL